MPRFEVGSSVTCREREWVVLPSEHPDLLMLRPLGGAEAFVQRRRAGVRHWLNEDTPFPARESIGDRGEVTYSLARSAGYRRPFDDVFELTGELIRESAAPGVSPVRQRACYWAALALLRCVMSSPATAEKALRVRAVGEADLRKERPPPMAVALRSPASLRAPPRDRFAGRHHHHLRLLHATLSVDTARPHLRTDSIRVCSTIRLRPPDPAGALRRLRHRD